MKRVRYTVCNPVEADLVAKAEHWPGLLAFLPGQTLKAKLPDVFFSKNGKMEEEAELTLTIPPHFAHMNEQEYITNFPKSSATTRPTAEHQRTDAKSESSDGLSKQAASHRGPPAYKEFPNRLQRSPDKMKKRGSRRGVSRGHVCDESTCKGPLYTFRKTASIKAKQLTGKTEDELA